uniref:ABC-2 type transport system permease protein n=1 Tax=uncultured Chloroflexota bacterium TaxID=166587 RepID=H5SBD6_9CHLR|nr:ABC-2 type transport system permease protein [uncultured Chloroflexota bacterium]BAL55912.1 ABC-2 type transport system permease protein [uncultured Chloroflexota bacterium]
MNIFWREFRAHTKSLLIYSLIIFLFSVTGFAKFKTYAEDPAMLNILNQMPKAVLDALNMRVFNLTTLSGFYGIMHIYYALILAIAAVMWGSEVIAKEERDKTVEFSLVLPITRGRLVTAKLLAVVAHSFLLWIATILSFFISSRSYTPDEGFWDFFYLSMAGLLLLQMIFVAIGISLGCALQQYRRTSAIALTILLATYFAALISSIHEKTEFLKYFSPFKYVDAGMIWREGRIEPIFLWLSLILIGLCIALAYWRYNHRDLYI